MFSDARRYRALRQALVLDANNHFEGYTNSDGVEFDGGQAPAPQHALHAAALADCRAHAPRPAG